ncbi:MAG: hypothetical protein HPY61_01685 [Methanotrichaceae archaeon]|nr:hypothetical protein [Methanotrichaceae archaeon]
MIPTRMAIAIFILILAFIAPALSGGYHIKQDSATHFNKIGDKSITSQYSYRDFISGVDPVSETVIHFDSQIGDCTPAITTFESGIEADNAYYARLSSEVSQELSLVGQSTGVSSVNVDSYVIMPKKFDLIQSLWVQMVEDEEPQAELRYVFTYDNAVYEFSSMLDADDQGTMSLFLQPYCPQFEGLDLDYVNTFRDSKSWGGVNYDGSLTMKAIKTDNEA